MASKKTKRKSGPSGRTRSLTERKSKGRERVDAWLDPPYAAQFLRLVERLGSRKAVVQAAIESLFSREFPQD